MEKNDTATSLNINNWTKFQPALQCWKMQVRDQQVQFMKRRGAVNTIVTSAILKFWSYFPRTTFLINMKRQKPSDIHFRKLRKKRTKAAASF
jgi:hypothetical protein